MSHETEIKARAFDILMRTMDGKHNCISQFDKYVEPGNHFPINAKEVTLQRVRVYTYEWRIRMKDRFDLRQALMDEAAAALKRELCTVDSTPSQGGNE